MPKYLPLDQLEHAHVPLALAVGPRHRNRRPHRRLVLMYAPSEGADLREAALLLRLLQPVSELALLSLAHDLGEAPGQSLCRRALGAALPELLEPPALLGARGIPVLGLQHQEARDLPRLVPGPLRGGPPWQPEVRRAARALCVGT